jgi:hypothetical protein
MIVVLLIQNTLLYYNNKFGGAWFYYTWISFCIPLWAIMTKVSKDVVIDGMILNVLILFSYFAVFYFFGEIQKLSTLNIIGIIMFIAGLILAKL